MLDIMPISHVVVVLVYEKGGICEILLLLFWQVELEAG